MSVVTFYVYHDRRREHVGEEMDWSSKSSVSWSQGFCWPWLRLNVARDTMTYGRGLQGMSAQVASAHQLHTILLIVTTWKFQTLGAAQVILPIHCTGRTFRGALHRTRFCPNIMYHDGHVAYPGVSTSFGDHTIRAAISDLPKRSGRRALQKSGPKTKKKRSHISYAL